MFPRHIRFHRAIRASLLQRVRFEYAGSSHRTVQYESNFLDQHQFHGTDVEDHGQPDRIVSIEKSKCSENLTGRIGQKYDLRTGRIETIVEVTATNTA